MRFRPSPVSTAVIGLLVGLFAWLSHWQLGRATDKEVVLAQFESAPQVASLSNTREDRFTRVRLAGRFDTERSFLVDNRVLGGRPGVHVLTPFQVTEEGPLLLVNRGWLPLPDRSHLPAVQTPVRTETIHGYLDGLQQPGATLGEPDAMARDAWPQLLTYPEINRMADALGEDLHPQVLYLAATAPAGFEGRDWRPVFMTPSRHRGYALQWAALALTGVVAWIALGVLRGKQEP